MPPTRTSEGLNTRPRRSLPSVSTSASNSAGTPNTRTAMAPPSSLPPRSRPAASLTPLMPPEHQLPAGDRRASLRRDAKSTSSPAPTASASSSSTAKSKPPAVEAVIEAPRASRSSLSKSTLPAAPLDPKTPEKGRATRSSASASNKDRGKAKGGMRIGVRSPEVKAAVAKARKQQIQAVTLAIAKSAEEDAEVDEVLGGDVFASTAAGSGGGEGKVTRKKNGKGGGKEYMVAGFYCQDANAPSPLKLVSKILKRRELEAKKNGRRKSGRGKPGDNLLFPTLPSDQEESFPPLPYDHGYRLFFDEEHEFVLPWNIKYEAETGKLDAKKKPLAYSKIRSNMFPERNKYSSDYVAICQCDASSACGERCINRIMNYLCGKNCPAGEACTNKSLTTRKGANVKVVYTGDRGFGLVAMEDIREGDFVIDYRGEVITLHTFLDRCRSDYSKSKNFYALAYDADEVIDAGNKGNEARFINHGCDPNLEVRKYQTLGDGQEEFEVGMWAIKDIKAGQELFYDYNFDSFAVRTSNESLRTRCRCGAANCVGFLGRKSGEKSARVIAQELEAKARADAAKSSKRAKKAMKSAIARASVKKGAKERVKAPKFQPQIKSKDVAKVRANTAASSAKRRQDAEAAKAEQRSVAMLATMADITSPLRPKTRQSNGAPPAAPSTPTAATPTSSSRKRAAATETPLTSLSSRQSAGGDSGEEDDTPNSKRSRNSGWADWLRKKAAEMPRTRENWEQFALQRRRGRVWMEGMMAEFGVAPYEGAPAEPYTPSIPLPSPGQPQRRGPPPGTPRPPRASIAAEKNPSPTKSGSRSARSSVGAASSPHGFIAHQLNGAPPAITLPPPTNTAAKGRDPPPHVLPNHHNGATEPSSGPSRGRRSMGGARSQSKANGSAAPAPLVTIENGTGPATRRTRSSLPAPQ